MTRALTAHTFLVGVIFAACLARATRPDGFATFAFGTAALAGLVSLFFAAFASAAFPEKRS